MLFPLLLQIIIKKGTHKRQEFPRLAHSSDGFQVEHFEERKTDIPDVRQVGVAQPEGKSDLAGEIKLKGNCKHVAAESF